MGDLVVGLAKSVVEGALTKAQSAIEEEARLRKSAQRDLVFIAGEFDMMLSFLRVADDERVRNAVVRTWVRQVRELAYDVEDCIEFVVHLDGRPRWWRRLLPPCVPALALPLDEAVDEIEQLKARVEDVSKRNTRYSLIGDSGSKPAVKQPPQAAAAGGANELDMLVGAARDNTAKKQQQGLADLAQLIAKKSVDLGVISVWGTAGDLGTTSTIRKAYDDPEIRPNFPIRAWVKLTHPFNPREFIHCLMAQFYASSRQEPEQVGEIVGVGVLRKMEATCQDDLLKEFAQEVGEKRFLVVLEDVTTMVEWDAVRTLLPDRKNGSWIIVSSQQCEIASLCVGHPYQVMELRQYSADHSLCVFFREESHGDGDSGKETFLVLDSSNEISNKAELSLNGCSSSYHRILTSKLNTAKEWMSNFTLVGREPQMNELGEYISMARRRSFQVMSVWGIAGVGKSSLVRNLYYNRMLRSDRLFDMYSWVDVSHPFNLRDLSRSLLLDFHPECLQGKGIRDPIQKCCRLLKEQRCLVVIDDLQTKEEWDLIQNALVPRPSKSLIIVITTEASIATHSADKDELVFNVKGLESGPAFDLFKKEVHRKNNSSPLIHSEDKEIHELLQKCGGLPKVIVAIADFLAPKTVTWMDTVCTMNPRFMHELESNPEFATLRDLLDWMHSYFRTCPDFLKPCIFYLSIFPQEHSIRRRRLIRRWIAEGYCRDTDNNSGEEIGEMFFSKLLDLSIIRQPPLSLNNVSMVLCQVNSFIREYIISRRMEENLVFELGGSCTLTTQRTGRHLIIRESWDRDRVVFESIDFSRLRSLTVFGEWKQFFISDRMRLLRVLDLEDASGVTDKDLEQIMKLLSRLKFLSLRGCSGISKLPSSLGDLRQLQTLDVRHTSIVTLPHAVTKLQKLQYIRAGSVVPIEEQSAQSSSVCWFPEFCRRHQFVSIKVPEGIGKLTALHTLGVINIGASLGKVTLKELKELTQLRKLGLSGINRKNSKELFAAISGHCHLKSLSVWLDKDNKGFLEAISLSLENLKSLKLYGLDDKLASWIRKPENISIRKMFHNIVKLDLDQTILGQDDIEVLGYLKKLCILRLSVKQLQALDFRVMANGLEDASYQNLKVLEISCSSRLDVSFGSVTMKALQLLEVRCFSGSQLHFSGLQNLTELKEVLLKGSYNETLNQHLRGLLDEHPNKPALKVEKQSS